MPVDLLQVLRSGDQIGDDEAIAGAEFLLEIGRERTSNRAIQNLAASLATRTENTSIAALIDWWAVVVIGAEPVGWFDRIDNGWMPPELQDWMVKCYKFHVVLDDSTVVKWLSSERRFKKELERFERALVLHESGVRVDAREEAAWALLADPFKTFLNSLRDGESPDPPRSEFKRVMKTRKVKESFKKGTGPYARVQRKYRDLVATADDLSTADQERFGPKSGPASEAPRFELSPVSENLHYLLALALDDNTTDERILSLLVDAGRPVLDSLNEMSHGADPETRSWLAHLTEDWLSGKRLSIPELAEPIALRSALKHRLGTLRTGGVDVSTVEESLDNDALDEAQFALQEIEDLENREKTTSSLKARLDSIEQGLDGELDSVGELAVQLQAARQHLSEGHFDETRKVASYLTTEIERLRQEERQTELANYQERAVNISDEATAAEIQKLLSEVSPKSRGITTDQVQRYAERVQIQEDLTTERLTKQLVELRERLAEGAESVDPVQAGLISDRLSSANAALEAGDIKTAALETQEARESTERWVFWSWTIDQGEKALVGHLINYAESLGEFDDTDICRLHVALKTKRFVVIAGLTGSGKSTIARAYAEAIGANLDNHRFRRIAVRPNWVDETETLGYLNPMDGTFRPGWLANMIRECNRHPDLPFFCVLDEMNLAPVEYYLADILSAMEDTGGSAHEARVPLYPPGADLKNSDDWPHELAFPTNLFIIGTVNIDETTQPLSDRVLDRANVIQLNVTTGASHHRQEDSAPKEQPWMVNMASWRRIEHAEANPDFHDVLVKIGQAFVTLGLGMGMRSHIEIERFVANASEVIDEPTDAFDLALLQRAIPKIRGYKGDLAEGLDELAEILKDEDAERCLEVVARWLDPDVSDEKYLNGMDTRTGFWSSG